jgi:signal transduction histidine kinase
MKQEPRFSLRSLTPQLFLFFVLPLSVLLLVVTVGGITLHQKEMREMVGERDQRAVRAAAKALSNELRHRMSAVQGIAQELDEIPDDQVLNEILNGYRFLEPDFTAGFSILDSSGKIQASNGDPELWTKMLAQQDTQIRSVLSGSREGTGLSQVYFIDGSPLMLAAARNPVSGAVVAGLFDPGTLIHNSLTDSISAAHGGRAFIVDSLGQVIFQSEGSSVSDGLASHPGVSQALGGGSGSVYIPSQKEHVTAYSTVPLANWALVVEESWESVSSPTLRFTEYAPLSLLPLVVATLLALWFGTNRIIEPLQALQSRAARLGWGDYETIEQPVGGIREIRLLQDELAHLARKVQAAQRGLRGYIGAMTAGQEDERRRLARELHDDTLQSLIALNQRLQLLRMKSSGDPGYDEVHLEINRLQLLAEETIQNLRRLTRALRPIYLEDLGLVTALEMLASEMSVPGLAIELVCTGNVQRQNPQVELALYRIAQEAINNVIRHAEATRVQISIAFSKDEVNLIVADNGKGFFPPDSPAAFAPAGHFGLLGMHERAEMIDASLRIQSGQGEGTRVYVHLQHSKDNPA